MAFHVPLETPWTLVTHWYFYQPRKSLKNTCLSVYMTFKPIPVCTRKFWANNRVHQKMCIKPKTFWVFLIESWINWLLAFHIPRKCLDSMLHFLLEGYILSLLDAFKEDNFGEKGNYSSLLSHLFMLESASLCPFGAHIATLPKISIEMEDWSGRGLGGEIIFSILTRCQQSFSLFYLCLL